MEKPKTSVSEIRESVNPVFKTARSCVTVNALLGDRDAQKLMAPLGFDLPFPGPDEQKMTPEMHEFVTQMSNPGFNIQSDAGSTNFRCVAIRLFFLIVVWRDRRGFGGELFDVFNRLFRTAHNARTGDAAAFARHHFDQVAGSFAVRICFEKS